MSLNQYEDGGEQSVSGWRDEGTYSRSLGEPKHGGTVGT